MLENKLLNMTVGEPVWTTSGGPTHVQGFPTVAAAWPPIRMLVQPAVMGPPTWGTGGTPGVTCGHVWLSPWRAAGRPISFSYSLTIDLDRGTFDLNHCSFDFNVSRSERDTTSTYRKLNLGLMGYTDHIRPQADSVTSAV